MGFALRAFARRWRRRCFTTFEQLIGKIASSKSLLLFFKHMGFRKKSKLGIGKFSPQSWVPQPPQQRFILFPLEWLGARGSCYPHVPLRQQPAHRTDSNLGRRGIVLSTNTQQEPAKPVRWDRQMVKAEEAVLPFHTTVEAQGYRMGSSWGGNWAQHLSLCSVLQAQDWC